MELLMSEKNPVESFFDIADRAMDTLEGVLSPAKPLPAIVDVESREMVCGDGLWWAMAGMEGSLGESNHLFGEGNYLEAMCGARFNSSDVRGRYKLVPGKRIVACTSCIIACQGLK